MSEEARLAAENAELLGRLREAEDTLAAIRSGEVDALIVGSQVYTLESADASSNRMRKDVLAQMEDAVVACDDAGHVIYLNPAAEARYGASSSTILGRYWTELYEEHWSEGGRERAAAELAESGASRSHTVQLTKAGTRLHAETTTTRLNDADGVPIGTLSVIRDVTERERIETALRESRAHLRFMLDSAGVGDWDLDLATLAVRHSLRHDQCFGYSQPVAEWSPDIFLAHVHPEDREVVAERFKTVLETKSDWHFECRVVWPDASIHWIEVHGAIYRGAGDAPARMLGTIVDITGRKLVEEALRNADRSKDEFLATLAHELRNPLAPIRNALEIMRLTREPETLESARHIIERQLTQMIHLVDDLLDISRITQGKIELRPERIDMLVVLQNAVETSRPLIEARRHELTLRLPQAETLMVRADATRLVQVIANLLNNAAKYTPEGGRIVLGAFRDAGHAVVTVEDSGIGIPLPMLPRVFDMFAQVERGTDRTQGGLGIGLALVKRLVEMHGGSVHAESGGERRGSRFTVRLPTIAAATVAAHPRSAPAEALPHVGTRVLVVDDNVDSASSLATMFELLGCHTAVAHDGLAAVREAETFAPDMAVLDIGLPGISGHEAARRIRQQPGGRSMLLVAVSGWGQDADRLRSIEAGFDHHLVKPVDMEALQGLLPRRAAGSNVHRLDRWPR